MKTWDNWKFLLAHQQIGHVVLAMFICLNVNALFQKPDVLNKFQRLRMASAEVSRKPKSAVSQLNSVSSWTGVADYMVCCIRLIHQGLGPYGDEVLRSYQSRFTIHACLLDKASGGGQVQIYITLLGMSLFFRNPHVVCQKWHIIPQLIKCSIDDQWKNATNIPFKKFKTLLSFWYNKALVMIWHIENIIFHKIVITLDNLVWAYATCVMFSIYDQCSCHICMDKVDWKKLKHDVTECTKGSFQ